MPCSEDWKVYNASILKRFIYFLATDLLFAQTIFGKAVPFATAGDCYSAARCPQVCHVCLFFPHCKKKKKRILFLLIFLTIILQET